MSGPPDVPDRAGHFGDVVIVGGGCYGTFYLTQLIDARGKGACTYRRLLVVDRNPDCPARKARPEAHDCEYVVADWDRFFDRYLSDAAAGDRVVPANSLIVPSPLMPHLMYRWVVSRARARWPDRAIETRPLDRSVGTPYEHTGPDRTQYVSYADWLCPTHCIEPALCPVIRAPRTWEMSEAVERYVAAASGLEPLARPVLFVCRHQVHGVGAFTVEEVLAGDRLVAEAGRGATATDVVVGTISACHGALNRLSIGPPGSFAGSGNR